VTRTCRYIGCAVATCFAALGLVGLRRAACSKAPVPESVYCCESLDRNGYIRLLREANVDSNNLSNRSGVGRVGRLFMDESLVKRCWPLQYAQEGLVRCGHTIRAPLRELALSAEVEPAVRYRAVLVLSRQDGAAGREASAAGYRAGLFSFEQLSGAIHLSLPFCTPTRQDEARSSTDLLELEDDHVRALATIGERSYEDVLLEQMDCVFTESRLRGGLYQCGFDNRIKRFLNRIGDQDIDEWLAQVAPAALEFRNREVATGYDPVSAFENLRTSADVDVDALAKILPAEDRAVCRELLLATVVPGSATYPPIRADWEDRLRAWYWANRASFKYDPDKLRLVVATGDAR
jgi:hypothetical protein